MLPVSVLIRLVLGVISHDRSSTRLPEHTSISVMLPKQTEASLRFTQALLTECTLFSAASPRRLDCSDRSIIGAMPSAGRFTCGEKSGRDIGSC